MLLIRPLSLPPYPFLPSAHENSDIEEGEEEIFFAKETPVRDNIQMKAEESRSDGHLLASRKISGFANIQYISSGRKSARKPIIGEESSATSTSLHASGDDTAATPPSPPSHPFGMHEALSSSGKEKRKSASTSSLPSFSAGSSSKSDSSGSENVKSTSSGKVRWMDGDSPTNREQRATR